jgi:protein tyrosine phosphatase (PTP) superfamily phosphohydrolase (DUF442 family)
MHLLDAATGLVNASTPAPWLLVGGQPSRGQLQALVSAGLRTVIDIREPMEDRTFDEPAFVAAAGLRYVCAPVVSGALDDASMTRVLDAVRASRDQPTLLHCNSANRTAGPVIAYLMLDEAVPQETAVNIAMRGGLRSFEILEWATGYAQRRLMPR